jgi:hypothetical protein
MRLEREIQDWIVQLARKSGLGGSDISSFLRYDNSPLSQEMRKRFGLDGALAPSRHRSVHEACRVLQSLVEPRFRSADTNISETSGQILKPDLVLEDEISGAFVIVELKRSRKAAREFASELLAYANCLLQQNPGSQVFLVMVSTSWAPLEQRALAELAQRHIPVLALEYREEGPDEATPTLWVRSDLLPVTSVEPFPAHALRMDTKVFWLPARWWNWWSRTAPWMNRIEHAVAALIREAERGRSSGFVLVWHLPYEVPSHGGSRSEDRVFVSMAVRNPSRPQVLPKFRDEPAATSFAWSNSLPVLTDDTAVRLLLDLEFGENVQCFSSESEGNWDDLRARLERENAHILRFDGFGEIGDQVSRWRTQKRHALRPVVPDITAFPAWHPLTWLSALESLINSSEQQEGDPLAWHAYRRGEDLSKFSGPHFAWCKNRNFGLTVAQARFARTWCDFFAAHQGAPKVPTQIDSFGLRCDPAHLEHAIRFATSRVAEEGELASLCFALGYHAGSGCDNIEYLLSLRDKLRMDGISLPQKLDAKVDELERLYKHHSRPDPATWMPLSSESGTR